MDNHFNWETVRTQAIVVHPSKDLPAIPTLALIKKMIPKAMQGLTAPTGTLRVHTTIRSLENRVKLAKTPVTDISHKGKIARYYGTDRYLCVSYEPSTRVVDRMRESANLNYYVSAGCRLRLTEHNTLAVHTYPTYTSFY